MAVWDKIQIVSLALGWLGKGPITSIDQAGDNAKVAGAAFDLLFPAEIAKYNWRFATTLVQLAELVPTPIINDWQHIFQLPSDFLALWRFYPDSQDFQIFENKMLYTNYSEVKIEYRFLPDISRLPFYFVDYFSLRLAARVALPVSQNKSFTKEIKDNADMALVQALATDTQSHPNARILSNPFVNPRF